MRAGVCIELDFARQQFLNTIFQSIEFRIGSRVIPNGRIRADFKNWDFTEMYLYCMESLGKSITRSGGVDQLRPHDWSFGGEFLLTVVDATVDLGADSDHRTTKEMGSVNLSITFAEALKGNVVGVVVSETDAELSIDSEGQVGIKT